MKEDRLGSSLYSGNRNSPDPQYPFPVVTADFSLWIADICNIHRNNQENNVKITVKDISTFVFAFWVSILLFMQRFLLELKQMAVTCENSLPNIFFRQFTIFFNSSIHWFNSVIVLVQYISFPKNKYTDQIQTNRRIEMFYWQIGRKDTCCFSCSCRHFD